MRIRAYEPRDWPGVWAVLEPVFRAGQTYAVPTDISEADAREMWVEQPRFVFVAEEPGEDPDREQGILGTYFIKTNQAGPGDHVCNCGYVVSERARGRGLASAMCVHSQAEARRAGYRGMQYNLVVATNTGAVRLWQKNGFDIVGTLPGAFRHPTEGFVDAHVMFKLLGDG
ncbi:acetyltransferase [Acidobacteria bacterium Mor1]|nr:acetyltransferase [Acidobacteria bacterium Mor1]